MHSFTLKRVGAGAVARSHEVKERGTVAVLGHRSSKRIPTLQGVMCVDLERPRKTVCFLMKADVQGAPPILRSRSEIHSNRAERGMGRCNSIMSFIAKPICGQ